MTGTVLTERVFGSADYDAVTPSLYTRLLTTGDGPPTPDARLAGTTTCGGPLWSTHVTAAGLGSAAAQLAGHAGVNTVTLAPALTPPPQLGLASAFATHLSAERARQHLTGTWITSSARPDPLPGFVRLPHLLTVTTVPTSQDTVVWELMAHAAIPAWLDGPLPEPLFAEIHHDALLRLRAAARHGHLPETAEGRQLGRLLRDRYLSLRLVYQHPHLFTTLLCTWEGI